MARHWRSGSGGVAGAQPARWQAGAVRRRLRGRRLCPLHEGAHLRRQRSGPLPLLRLHARDPLAQVRVPGAGSAGHRRHGHDDLRRRPHRALSGPRAAEPGALRGGRHPPRRRALERGRVEVFRARRLVVGHAALRRLADLRLHRLHQLYRHRRSRQGERCRAGYRPDHRPGVPVGGPCLQDLRRALPHVDARRLRGRSDPGHGLLLRRPQGRRYCPADACDARCLRRHRSAVAAGRVGAGHRLHGSWRVRRHRPDQHQAAAWPTPPSATSAMR